MKWNIYARKKYYENEVCCNYKTNEPYIRRSILTNKEEWFIIDTINSFDKEPIIDAKIKICTKKGLKKCSEVNKENHVYENVNVLRFEYAKDALNVYVDYIECFMEDETVNEMILDIYNYKYTLYIEKIKKENPELIHLFNTLGYAHDTCEEFKKAYCDVRKTHKVLFDGIITEE